MILIFPPGKSRKMRFCIFKNMSSSLSSRNGTMRLMYTCWQQQQSDERDLIKNITAGFRTKIQGRRSEENKKRRRARLDVPMTHSHRGKGWDDVMTDDKWCSCDSPLSRRAGRSVASVADQGDMQHILGMNSMWQRISLTRLLQLPTECLYQWPPSVTCVLKDLAA